MKLDQDAFTIRALPANWPRRWSTWGTAAMLMARHIKLENVHPWAMVNACTHGRLLTAARQLSRNRRSAPPPARRRLNPPRICLQPGTSPTRPGTTTIKPSQLPGSSSAS